MKIDLDFGGAKCPKFNLCGPVELDNLKLAELVAKSVNKKLKYEMVDFHKSRPGHDLRYSLDSSKIRNSMNWKNKTNFNDGLEKTISWVQDNFDSKKIHNDVLNPTPWKTNN